MKENLRGRAYRRHHYKRLKAKRVRECYWGRGYTDGTGWCKESLGIAINTPTPHSCYLCGNMRDLEGPTRQEKRSASDIKDSLRDLHDNGVT